MEENIILISLIVLIIAISGCTNFDFNLGGVSYNTNPIGRGGINVVSFTTETPTLLPGEEGLFELKIKNTGSVRATNGFAELLGIDQSWSRTGGEIFPNENPCRYDVRDIMLLPKDERTGGLGGEYVCTWDYKAPKLPLGSVDYDIIARVYYNYSTTSVSTVTLVPKEEMKIYVSNGGTVKSDIISHTASPVKITLTPKSPIKIYPEGSVEIPVEIKIQNVGGGTICLDIGSCKKSQSGGHIWNDLKIDITLPDGIDNVNCPEEVHVPKGSSQTIGCKLKITDDVETVTQKYIKIYSEYGYFIDSGMNIRVDSGI